MVHALSQHLVSVLDAVLYGTTGNAIGVVFSPLCHIAPRVLLMCLRCLSTSSTTSSTSSSSSSSSTVSKASSDRFNTTPHHTTHTQPTAPHTHTNTSSQGPGQVSHSHTQLQSAEDRAKFLRSVVSCQQSLALLLESRCVGTYVKAKDRAFYFHKFLQCQCGLYLMSMLCFSFSWPKYFAVYSFVSLLLTNSLNFVFPCLSVQIPARTGE